MNLKAAKAVVITTNTLGGIVIAGLAAGAVWLLYLWASVHPLSFLIVIGVVAVLGLLLLRSLAKMSLEEYERDEEFFNKHKRYPTQGEKYEEIRRHNRAMGYYS